MKLNQCVQCRRIGININGCRIGWLGWRNGEMAALAISMASLA